MILDEKEDISLNLILLIFLRQKNHIYLTFGVKIYII